METKKLSISTNITNPRLRGDNYLEAIKNYSELADEVVVVDGDSTDGSLKEIEKLGLDNVKVVFYKWKMNWNWEQIPKSFNFGIESCTGDWVIKMDIDRFFMEKDFAEIRSKLEDNPDKPVASFICYNFPLYNKYFCKGFRACAINRKEFGDKIKLGKATNEFLSLSHPIEVRGEKDGIYEGVYDNSKHLRIGVSMFNFDGTFKTKEHIEYFWFRYWKAYYRYYKTGMPFKKGDEVKHYMEYHKPEIEKAQDYEGKYPEVIKQLIDTIKPGQFGFNGWKK